MILSDKHGHGGMGIGKGNEDTSLLYQPEASKRETRAGI